MKLLSRGAPGARLPEAITRSRPGHGCRLICSSDDADGIPDTDMTISLQHRQPSSPRGPREGHVEAGDLGIGQVKLACCRVLFGMPEA
jgi:hypothetical protein